MAETVNFTREMSSLGLDFGRSQVQDGVSYWVCVYVSVHVCVSVPLYVCISVRA